MCIRIKWISNFNCTLKLNVELKKNIYIYMYVNCIIPKVHISSICAVNSHFVFSESFGIFVLCSNLSLPKHISHNLIRRVILTY